ncbi:MAG TPA: GNAT family N-acetyltransferase, partial [Brevibacterium ravenspurgense]|nr:GNAT family N-acetyltransferase [Brevibacterium ravenspurgense]
MRLTGPQGVVLRPLKRADAEEFAEVRVANRDWLQPWDATLPGTDARGGALREERAAFHSMRRALQSQARRGVALPFALEVDGSFRGQVTAASIQWGSISSVQIGYWIDSRLAGRGLMPLAVAMTVDACFFDLGLHRVEINIRPENSKSLRVVEKLGFRFEGVRRGYMHIAGKWADH